MKHEEAKLQLEVVKLLQERKIYFFSIPNEAHGRSAVQQMQLVSMGMRSGASDMVIVLQKRVVFLELKAEKGIQSTAQKKFQEIVTLLGHEYLLIRSLKDLLDKLDYM